MPLKLLIVSIIFLLTIPPSFIHCEELYTILWQKNLRTDQDVDNFINGKARIVHETIYYNPDPNYGVVFGSSSNATLKFIDTITLLSGKRTTHQVIIEIPSLEVYRNVLSSLKAVAEADWLYLALELFQGPQGGEPALAVNDVKEIIDSYPRGFKLIYRMTVGHDPAKERGLTLRNVEEIKLFSTNAGLVSVQHYSFVIDAYHISHTAKSVLSVISREMLRRVSSVEVYASEESAKLVNMKGLVEFIKEATLEICFLNVPEKMRQDLLRDLGVIDENISGGSGGVRLVVKMMTRLMVLGGVIVWGMRI